VVAGRSAYAGPSRAARRYALDGTVTLAPDNRLATTVTVTDKTIATRNGRVV
jgi:hypothetical protein